MEKWLSKEEIAELIGFANSRVSKSEFKGTFTGYDVAIEVMLANDGKSLKQHMELINKRISKEFKVEQFDTHNADWIFNQLVVSTHWLKDKLLNDAVYHLKHLKRNNVWEKNQRAGNTAWSINRNMKAKMKARAKTEERNQLLVLLQKNAA